MNNEITNNLFSFGCIQNWYLKSFEIIFFCACIWNSLWGCIVFSVFVLSIVNVPGTSTRESGYFSSSREMCWTQFEQGFSFSPKNCYIWWFFKVPQYFQCTPHWKIILYGKNLGANKENIVQLGFNLLLHNVSYKTRKPKFRAGTYPTHH